MRAGHDELVTEQRNPNTEHLDTLGVPQLLKLINEEDRTVTEAVNRALPQIAQAIEAVIEVLQRGGNLLYIGAGTSGRLGVLDASECLPTFGVSPSLVQGIIAGGDTALRLPIENAEDDEDAGAADIAKAVTAGDAVIGITASGQTPYVIGAVKRAVEMGALTAGISCNPNARLSRFVRYPIELNVGPEVLTGSTRMKAGTAQKMVLNMISTVSMIHLGKTYGNLMVDVQASNQKLRERIKRIIMDATGVDYAAAESLADAAQGDAKLAIVMQRGGTDAESARTLLRQADGFVRRAIEDAGQKRW